MESLLRNSPFGAGSSAAVAPAGDNPALEFRGVVVESSCTLFSIFEGSSGLSCWVELNEAGRAFTVRSYDAAKVELKVVYRGREISLGLKSRMMVADSAAPGAATPAAVPPEEKDAVAHLAGIARAAAHRLALGL